MLLVGQGDLFSIEVQLHPLEAPAVVIEGVLDAIHLLHPGGGQGAFHLGQLEDGSLGQLLLRLGVLGQRLGLAAVQDVLQEGLTNEVLGVVQALRVSGGDDDQILLGVHQGILAAHAAAGEAALGLHPELVAVATGTDAGVGDVVADLLGGGLHHILAVHELLAVPLAALEAEEAKAGQITGGAQDAAAGPGALIRGLDAPDVLGDAQLVQQGAHVVQQRLAGQLLHNAAQNDGGVGVIVEDGAGHLLVSIVIEETLDPVGGVPIVAAGFIEDGHHQQIADGRLEDVGGRILGDVFREEIGDLVIDRQAAFGHQHADRHGGEGLADGVHTMLAVSIKGGTVALRRHLAVAQHQIAVKRNPVGLHILQEVDDSLGRDAQGFRACVSQIVLRHDEVPPKVC